MDGYEVAGFRGEKAKARGMEQVATRAKADSVQGQGGRTAVKLIPQQRMSQAGKMGADLVGAPGFQAAGSRRLGRRW